MDGERMPVGTGSGESGQAAVAFVAVVPVLVIVALALLQAALAGHAAARADYVGADPERAARRALPPSFRSAAAVDVGADSAAVEVMAPRALPLGPRIPVSAASL